MGQGVRVYTFNLYNRSFTNELRRCKRQENEVKEIKGMRNKRKKEKTRETTCNVSQVHGVNQDADLGPWHPNEINGGIVTEIHVQYTFTNRTLVSRTSRPARPLSSFTFS